MIEIKKLTKEILNSTTGLFQTLESLTEAPELSKEKTLEIFEKISKNNITIFVAIKENQIIGTISVIIEQKFIHLGRTVSHIEDVSINKNFQKQGISRKLIETAIKFSKTQNSYKIILDCDEKLENFYNKFEFQKQGIMMRFNI